MGSSQRIAVLIQGLAALAYAYPSECVISPKADGYTPVTCDNNNSQGNYLYVLNPTWNANDATQDFADVTGTVPDGSKITFTTEEGASISTSFMGGLSFSPGFEAKEITGSVSASIGVTVTVTYSVSETESTEITVNCPGSTGRVQTQGVYLSADTSDVWHLDGKGSSTHYSGKLFIPRIGAAGAQLTNYRIACSDGSFGPTNLAGNN